MRAEQKKPSRKEELPQEERGTEVIGARRETEVRVDRMATEERQAIGGILSKMNEIPKGVKKAVLMLAAAGTIYTAKHAEAGDHFRNGMGWQENVWTTVGVQVLEQVGQARGQRQMEQAQYEYQAKTQQLQRDYMRAQDELGRALFTQRMSQQEYGARSQALRVGYERMVQRLQYEYQSKLRQTQNEQELIQIIGGVARVIGR